MSAEDTNFETAIDTPIAPQKDANTKEESSASSIKSPPPPPKAVSILIPSNATKIHESVESLWKALKPHGFYYSGGEVVTVQRTKKGKARMESLSSNALASQVTAYGARVVEQQMTAEGLKERAAHVSSELAAKALASPAAKQILPPLEMIHSSPLLVEERNNPRHPKILRGGYHHELGGRFVSGGAAQDIPFSEAKEIIQEIFEEYNFASPSDRSRAFAALLTPAIRFGGIAGFKQPLLIIEADMSQGGKTFFCKLIQSVYGESCSTVTQIDRGVGSTDESLKSALVSGKPFVLLDNIRGAMDTRWLEAAITTDDEIACRVPGAAKEVDPNNFIFQLTSNGFVASADLLNRACVVRIKRRQGHAYREYKEGDGELPDYIRAKQGRFLGAAYSILKQWIIAGKPRTTDTRVPGTLRKWWQAADWICQNLLEMPSPIDGWADTAKRAANPELTWLRSLSIAVLGDENYKSEPLSLEDVRHAAESGQVETPGLSDRTPVGQRNPIIGNLLTRIFKRKDRVEIDGMEIACSLQRVARADGKGYREQKFLTFVKIVAEPTPEPPPSDPVEEEPDIEVADASFDDYVDRLAEVEAASQADPETDSYYVEEEKKTPETEEKMEVSAVNLQFKETAPLKEYVKELLRMAVPTFTNPKFRQEYVPSIVAATGVPEEKIHKLLDEITTEKDNTEFLESTFSNNRDTYIMHYVGPETGYEGLVVAN